MRWVYEQIDACLIEQKQKYATEALNGFRSKFYSKVIASNRDWSKPLLLINVDSKQSTWKWSALPVQFTLAQNARKLFLRECLLRRVTRESNCFCRCLNQTTNSVYLVKIVGSQYSNQSQALRLTNCLLLPNGRIIVLLTVKLHDCKVKGSTDQLRPLNQQRTRGWGCRGTCTPV